jgi:predicted membrane-bound spermidine synthase
MQSWSATLAHRKSKDTKRRDHEKSTSDARAATRHSHDSLPPLALVALLVFMSGCSALVFQVAWMRDLRLIFGATTAAVAAVLAIFMAGLGFGSAILGKLADRVENPLRLYGILEAVIALSVSVSPWCVALASSIYFALGGQETLGLTGATTARLLLAAVIMAVPTFLMGGTLPAAVRAVTRADDSSRRSLGMLYGSNTLGAVFGAAAATFFALEHLGTRATLWTGCAIGLTAGLIAVRLSRSFGMARTSQGSTRQVVRQEPQTTWASAGETARISRPHLIYFAAALLGFTFFALEIVWYRMLAPILGGTAFTFGLILCVALLGIGIGGILYNVLFRWFRPSMAALAITCGCEALFTIIPFALGDRLALLAAWRANSATTFSELVVAWSYVTCIVVLPVALVSGVQFPLMTALLGQGRASVSNHLGMTYAWNTLGAIAGSLVAGFGALPLLSATGLWQAIAIVLSVLSVIILVCAARTERSAAVAVAILAVATVTATLTHGPTAAWRHSGIGAGRTAVPPAGDPNRIRQWINEKRRMLEWEADGIESSIGLVVGDGTNFFVNGKSDGNSLTDAPTQVGVALLGAVLHKDPSNALVIGLGTGESAGWLAEMRNIDGVDVVEIEPAIDEMALRCRELNWNVLLHPRVRRIYNDGREFIFAAENKYDLILSEPSNPYRAGIASLYTSEFYQAVRGRLKPGGLFIQWLQAYEVNESTVLTVVATVRDAFQHVEIWQTLAGDLQLVCSATPLEYSLAELRARIADEAVQDALSKAWNANDVEGFLGHFVANSRWADALVAQPQIVRNTDDRTLLEYGFAKSLGREAPFSIEEARDRFRAGGYHHPQVRGTEPDWDQIELRRQECNLIFSGQLSIALLPDPEDRAVIEAFDLYRSNDFSGAIAMWPAKHLPPSTDLQSLVLAHCYAELANSECLSLIRALAQRFPIETSALRAIYHWRAGKIDEAARALEEFYLRLADSPWVMPIFVETAFSRTIDVARADSNAAARLYKLLSRPFASRRFDHIRVTARFMVAEQLGPQYIAEALSEMEPNIIWTKEILEPRATAYETIHHPLADQAKRDWDWFQRHQPAE